MLRIPTVADCELNQYKLCGEEPGEQRLHEALLTRISLRGFDADAGQYIGYRCFSVQYPCCQACGPSDLAGRRTKPGTTHGNTVLNSTQMSYGPGMS